MQAMDWQYLFPTWERNNVLDNQVNNWTSPFFSNIVQKFNNSLAGPQRFHNNTLHDDSTYFTEQTLFLFPLIIILFFKQLIAKEESNGKNITFPVFQLVYPKSLFCVISYAMFFLTFPFLLCAIALSYLWRRIAKTILKHKYSENFVDLMDGSDAIWAVEEDVSKSIINVVATLKIDTNDSIEKIFQVLKSKIQNKLFLHPHSYPKLFYRRSYDLGYFFWEKGEIDIDQFVRPLEPKHGELSKDDLYETVSELSNADLPYNNTATWEILVGHNPLNQIDCESNECKYYPIVFRIHHSLGDGVVLLKLLLKAIADEHNQSNRKIEFALKGRTSSVKIDSFLQTQEENYLRKYVANVMNALGIIALVPLSVVGQFIKPPDINVLHPESLDGKKLCVWLNENDDESMLTKIKTIKRKIEGATFSDLFVTALSASLHKYYTQNASIGKMEIPKEVTSIVPIRVEKSDLNLGDKKMLKLENKFSVGMLPIPIQLKGKTSSMKITHLKRFTEVRNETSKLRNSADFYVNYFIMSLLGHVFPGPLLRPVLKSDKASLVISNLPGPQALTICDGRSIQDIAFFVPHRGNTGMGVTLLSYNNKINLGLMVDRAVLKDKTEAINILQGIKEELDILNNITSKLMFSPSNSFEMH